MTARTPRPASRKRLTADRRISQLEAILAIASRINAGNTLEEVLDHIYEGFRRLIPYDRLGCALIEARSGRVQAIWARSRAERLELDRGYSATLAGSSLARIAATGRPRILNDLQKYAAMHPASEATRRVVADGVRSSLTCPLVANGKAIGFLFFSSNKAATYTAAHTDAYQEIAALVSLVVEKTRAREELVETQGRLVAANRVLARAAYFDPLTGAPGRRYFDMLFEREWKRAMRHAEPLAVITVDVDHFKPYNDLYGHPAGDECLRKVAQALLSGARRGTDLVARVGGEEFAALLPATRPTEALALAGRLRKRVASLEIPHGGSPVAPHVTVSLGVAATVPRRGDDAKQLLRWADAALYRAKEAGRDRAVLAESDGLAEPEPRAARPTARVPRSRSSRARGSTARRE